MRSPAEITRVLALALLLAACVDGTPTRTPGVTLAPSASNSMSVTAPSSPSPAGVESAEPTTRGISLPTPGTPWDGSAVLGEMDRSTRPGGVPEELRTAAIAEAIAQRIWTVDGAAWDTFAIGGFCSASTCTLDVAGSHLGRAGEDLWTLEVDPATGEVEPIVAELRSLPWDLVDELDQLARSLDHHGALGGMTLATARWLPPSAEPGRFVLSYRSGGEEGACARDLLVDAAAGIVVEQTDRDC